MARYDEFLDRGAAGLLSEPERSELGAMRQDTDRFILRKAHAAALLRWLGHAMPQP